MRKPRAVSGFALKWAGACAPWLGLALLAPVAQAQAQEAAAPLHETLQTYCIKCHNSEDWAGSLDLGAFEIATNQLRIEDAALRLFDAGMAQARPRPLLAPQTMADLPRNPRSMRCLPEMSGGAPRSCADRCLPGGTHCNQGHSRHDQQRPRPLQRHHAFAEHYVADENRHHRAERA